MKLTLNILRKMTFSKSLVLMLYLLACVDSRLIALTNPATPDHKQPFDELKIRELIVWQDRNS